jgi:hypothetical protein
MSLAVSPRLSLKRNDGSDPFKRQDFIDNWDKLDLTPGCHICTSTSRPTWGAPETGRSIYETNTRQELVWTGSAFVEPLLVGSSWVRTATVGFWQTPGWSGDWVLPGSVVTTRPGTLTVIQTVGLSCTADAGSQSVSLDGLINGTPRTVGGYVSIQFPFLGAGATIDRRIITIISSYALGVGTHTIGTRVAIGAGAESIYIQSISAVGFLTNTTAT